MSKLFKFEFEEEILLDMIKGNQSSILKQENKTNLKRKLMKPKNVKMVPI